MYIAPSPDRPFQLVISYRQLRLKAGLCDAVYENSIAKLSLRLDERLSTGLNRQIRLIRLYILTRAPPDLSFDKRSRLVVVLSVTYWSLFENGCRLLAKLEEPTITTIQS